MDRLLKQVLLIDDSATVRDILSDWLSEERYTVIAADSYDSLEGQPWIEGVFAVVSDIVLPGISGIDGINMLRKQYPDLAIVAMSAGDASRSKQELLHSARQMGADAHLVKPFDKDTLHACIDHAKDVATKRNENNGIRVLIIDDSRTVLAAVKKMLDECGFITSTAESADQAIDDENIIGIDVVLTDIFMPGEDGISLTYRLKQTWPFVKVVAMSAGLDGKMASSSALRAADRVGADATIGKPFEQDAIERVIRNVLDGTSADVLTFPSNAAD